MTASVMAKRLGFSTLEEYIEPGFERIESELVEADNMVMALLRKYPPGRLSDRHTDCT